MSSDELDTTLLNYTADASISGTVWWDENHNSAIDYPEYAIPGAVVELYSQSNPTVLLTSTKTNSLGRYSFPVDSGAYALRNATHSEQGCIPVLGTIQDGEGESVHEGLGIADPDQSMFSDVNLKEGYAANNYNFGEEQFPIQLISKRMFLASSDPLVALPEPSTWLGLLAAGGMGLLYWVWKQKRTSPTTPS